jgi:hypothetical protein
MRPRAGLANDEQGGWVSARFGRCACALALHACVQVSACVQITSPVFSKGLENAHNVLSTGQAITVDYAH